MSEQRLEAIPPVPIRELFADEAGLVSRPWVGFFGALARTVTRGPVEATHADRLAQHAARQSRPGALAWETDRTSWYIIRVIAGEKTWRWLTGRMAGDFADRPADLGVDDAGFEFEASDYAHLWRWSGTAWAVVSGRMDGDFADRPTDLGADDEGFEYEASDYLHIWRWSGTAWAVVSGEMTGTIYSPDEKPTDLTADDANFRFRASDYNRRYRWTGTDWERSTLTEEAPRGQIALYHEAPSAGWVLCDGAGSRRSKNDGSTETFTTKDLIGYYLKGAAAWADGVAAVAGTVSGTVASAGSHSHGGVTGGNNSFVTEAAAAGGINKPNDGHTHNIASDGAHTHTVSGTSTGATPPHAEAMPYERI